MPHHTLKLRSISLLLELMSYGFFWPEAHTGPSGLRAIDYNSAPANIQQSAFSIQHSAISICPVFRYRRRVQFAETDLAGIVHFTCFFRYMEEAEHALWRAAGLSIAKAGEATGWPRLAATFDFKAPLRFEDEFDVLVQIANVTQRTLQYEFTVIKESQLVGRGTLTTALVSKTPGEPMKALDVPEDVIARLRRASEAGVGADG